MREGGREGRKGVNERVKGNQISPLVCWSISLSCETCLCNSRGKLSTPRFVEMEVTATTASAVH